MNEVCEAASALSAEIQSCADNIERERCLPPRIVEGLKRAGVFRMTMPGRWGGYELGLPEQLEVVETLSRFDGSVGWCAVTGSMAGFASSWLEQDTARQIFHDIDSPCAGSLLFAGRAERVEGGYSVSGRWPFNSGCGHASVFILTCHVVDPDRRAAARPEGAPELRVCFMPSSAGRVLDTWHSTGLRGTGSHDIEVKDVFVPESHTAGLPIVHSHRPGPLYVHPGPAAYVLPAVALGIARHAVDAFIGIALERELTVASLRGRSVLLRDSPHAQVAVSQAEGLVRSARCLVYEVAGEVWLALTSGQRLSARLRADYSLAVTNAHRSCVSAVDLLYKANGGSSVYERCPLDRCFRDIHTVNQHYLTSAALDEKAGRALLGLEVGDEMF